VRFSWLASATSSTSGGKKSAACEDCAHSFQRRIGNSRCAQWKEQCAEEVSEPVRAPQQENEKMALAKAA
jgi:hypothetical protein